MTWNNDDHVAPDSAAAIRDRIAKSGDRELIELAAKLTDQQIERLGELVKAGVV